MNSALSALRAVFPPGALGLQQVQAQGSATWARTPARCAVAGMPGKAIELGAANAVLTPAEMVARISDFG